MHGYVLKRLLAVVPVMLGLTVIVFLIMSLIPGDPATAILGSYATPENVARLNSQLGLDKPLFQQYFIWLSNLLQGDLGHSYSLNRPVLDEVLERFSATLILAGAALVLCTVWGILIGIWTAARQFGWTDRILTFAVLIGISVPSFWLGLLLILVFAVNLRWLPASGMYAIYGGGDLPDLLRHLVLPALTLSVVATGVIARLPRSAMLEVLRQDYIRTARAKGVSEGRVLYGHAFRAALVSVIPVVGVQAGFVLGGAVYIETVFQWPGVGRMLVQAISQRDILLVQGGVIVVAASYVLFNLLADLAQSLARSPGEDMNTAALANAARLLFRNRLAGFGAVVLSLVFLITLAAPLLPLPDPDITDPANRLLRPLAPGHLLGTDHLGRDLLSRLIWGTLLSLAVGISASLIAATIGSAIGIIAGYFGGRTDNVIMHGVDMLMAFPYILLALAIVAVLGPGLLNALYAVAVVNIPFFARNIRGATVAIAHREFVDGARLSGMGDWRIIWSEILLNVLPVIVIAMSTTVGWMILETAGLSFLGLGSQPPQADLGSMLGEGRKLLITAPHASIVPGAMIFIIVMSINLLGDGIRDALDPRLRSGALSRPAPVTRVERASVPGRRDTDAVLSVDKLETCFEVGERIYRAVQGVDLEVRRGECLGIIGESGSGKSVTALSLLGLVAWPPGVICGGRVDLDGTDLLAIDFETLRSIRGGRVSYVFQDPLSTLHPLYPVGDQLVEAIRCHRPVTKADTCAEAVELLRQVRIPNPEARVDNYPHEMSGGMRQRVGIAMALANDPDVIIADEPPTALDVTVQAQILSMLSDLRTERDLALVFITHDFGVVAQLCDRVLVMYAGQIVESGPASEVLAAPSHPYTARLMECVPQLGGGRRELSAIPGLPPAVDNLPLGCGFAPRCDRAGEDCRAAAIETSASGPGRSVRCLHPVELSP